MQKQAAELGVDMHKLGQFREKINIKYEWRTNFNRIFKEWDTRRNGQITVDDVQKIGKKMGFELNRSGIIFFYSHFLIYYRKDFYFCKIISNI